MHEFRKPVAPDETYRYRISAAMCRTWVSPELFQSLHPGTELDWKHEPANLANPRAIRLAIRRKGLGYLPDLLLQDVHAALESGGELRVSVERVNLPPEPIQHRLLVRVELWSTVDGFKPFTAEPFQPLASDASSPIVRTLDVA